MNLKAVPAEFPAERVEGLVDKAVDAGEDWARWFGEPVVNLVESLSDAFMKANADFREKLGMSPKIRRDSYARCCDWCADLAGVYDYHDTPDEIYARHEFCRCVVTFENGRMRQDVWSKQSWKADRDELDRRREYGLDRVSREDSGLTRRTTNPGPFSVLPERMSKKHIREIAEEFDISLKHVIISIDMDPEKLKPGFMYAGRADDRTVGRIDFFPKAFSSKEELVRTLYHERIHVMQFREYGVEYVQKHRLHFEELADKSENDFISSIKEAGLL